MDITAEFMSATINAFEANKRLADRAVEQVPDDKLHVALDANTNSIAVIMKHVAGNLISRWTLDRLPNDGRREAVAEPGRRVCGLLRQPGRNFGVVGAGLGLFANYAQESEAGRPRKDGHDPW